MSTDLIISRVDQARVLLAEAKDATAAKRVVDIAHAAEVYAKRQKLSEDAIAYAHEIRIDAMALLGEFLKASPKNSGAVAGGKKTGPRGTYEEPRDNTPTLATIGITKKESAAAQFIADLRDNAPEQFAAVKGGKATLTEVHREKKRKETRERVTERIKEAPLKGSQRFPVIYADPPWRYEHSETHSRDVENQYPTMDLEAICALEINEIAASDAMLFLWATSPKLKEAMQVIERWGFDYRTCMVWVKDKIGMGYYARQQHELLLIAKRGEIPPPLPANRPSSVINSPRGKHSAKPVEVYTIIEAMYPEFPKVELFCRNKREGWEAWGNEGA